MRFYSGAADLEVVGEPFGGDLWIVGFGDFAMDPEQTFLRVHTRLSGVLARLFSPKLRSGLEFVCLCNAVMLLGLLVVMHVNFVAQVEAPFRCSPPCDLDLNCRRPRGWAFLCTEGGVSMVEYGLLTH